MHLYLPSTRMSFRNVVCEQSACGCCLTRFVFCVTECTRKPAAQSGRTAVYNLLTKSYGNDSLDYSPCGFQHTAHAYMQARTSTSPRSVVLVMPFSTRGFRWGLHRSCMPCMPLISRESLFPCSNIRDSAVLCPCRQFLSPVLPVAYGQGEAWWAHPCLRASNFGMVDTASNVQNTHVHMRGARVLGERVGMRRGYLLEEVLNTDRRRRVAHNHQPSVKSAKSYARRAASTKKRSASSKKAHKLNKFCRGIYVWFTQNISRPPPFIRSTILPQAAVAASNRLGVYVIACAIDRPIACVLKKADCALTHT